MAQSLDPEQLGRHMARLRMLYEASQRFAEQVTDTESLLDTIARACSQLVGDFAAITLVRPDGEWMDLVAVHHPDPELDRNYRAFSKTAPVRVGDGVMGGVIKSDRALLLPEVDPESIVARAPVAYRDIARRLNVCSFVGVAMHARGRVVGGISMARSGAGAPYNDEDVALARARAGRRGRRTLHARQGQRVPRALATHLTRPPRGRPLISCRPGTPPRRRHFRQPCCLLRDRPSLSLVRKPDA